MTENIDIYTLFEEMIRLNASDLLITTGSPPIFRVNGEINPKKEIPLLTDQDTMRLICKLLNENQIKAFDEKKELDSMVLEGILCQRLVPNVKNTGRVLVTEVLIPSDAIRNMIRRGEIRQIYSQMLLERGNGNQTFNDSLYQHYLKGEISHEMALSVSIRTDEMMRMIKGEGRTNHPLIHEHSHSHRHRHE